MTETVASVVGSVLADLGIGHAFGVVGSGNFHVTNALRAQGVPFTAARHEGGAACMADGYSRLAALPAVLSVHQGCGLTNAMTGIGEAAKSRTPMIVLAADTAGAAVNSNFRVDQDALAVSVGAVAERVHSPASAVADITRAYTTATRGRRTVVVSLPLDVQAAPPGPASLNPGPAPRSAAPAPARPAASAIDDFAALLAMARRPVFIAGRGGRAAGPGIAALARQAGALLATSAVANGLFAGDEFNLGISGGFATPLAAELIAGADLIVGWGCALNMWTTRHGTLIGPAARLVQVDDDLAALGAHQPVDLAILGDCGATASDALDALKERKAGYRTAVLSARLAGQRWWNDIATADLGTADRIDPREFSKALDRMLPAQRLVSVDSGNFMGYPSAYLRVPDELGFCFTQAFQSVGLGLASGIGASLAQPGRLPVIATGDGGFLMGVAELETAVRLGRPMLVAVYNDAAYGAEVHHFGDAADRGAVVFPDSDIAAIASGFGAAGLTVRTPRDMAAVEAWARDPAGVLVIDAKIASDGGSWWLAEAFRGH
jgi:thiamine pyrophosphate-dependent acetolactate synthase large subunit-like protein